MSRLRDLIKKVLISATEAKIMYYREILEYIDENDVIDTNQNSEILLSDIELENVYFFELERLNIPDDITEYIKLINKIKKSDIEKDKPEYIIDYFGINFLTEEMLREFYTIDFIIDELNNIEIYNVKYLKPERIKL